MSCINATLNTDGLKLELGSVCRTANIQVYAYEVDPDTCNKVFILNKEYTFSVIE